MKNTFNFTGGLLALLTFNFSGYVNALPIDWGGNLGFEQAIIQNARGTDDTCTVANGSECIEKNNQHARFQALLLKLNPSIIVNDSVTIKGEVTTGNFRGGYLGTDGSVAREGERSYFAQSSNGSVLNFTQLYAELYADTALFRVGKYSKHYGLGAVINSGSNSWDRFFSGYEGFEAEFKLGNFKLIPAISKIDSDSGLPNGRNDTNEQSIVALYDNVNKNLTVGVMYANREVETNSNLYTDDKSSQNTTLIDIFFEKSWGDFNLAVEVPLLSGEVGTAFTNGSDSQDFDARAYLMEASYQLSPKWKLGVNAGIISGSDDDQDSQEAMYLHPNFQIAEVMFRYDRQGFQDSTRNAFRSNMTNMNYAKIYAHYESDSWSWRMDLIMATANEVASAGKEYFDHSNQTYQTATLDQEDDLGLEFDVAFDYKWSPSVIITGYIGYYQVGEFYEFTNDSNDEISVSDITASGMKVNIGF